MVSGLTVCGGGVALLARSSLCFLGSADRGIPVPEPLDKQYRLCSQELAEGALDRLLLLHSVMASSLRVSLLPPPGCGQLPSILLSLLGPVKPKTWGHPQPSCPEPGCRGLGDRRAPSWALEANARAAGSQVDLARLHVVCFAVAPAVPGCRLDPGMGGGREGWQEGSVCSPSGGPRYLGNPERVLRGCLGLRLPGGKEGCGVASAIVCCSENATVPSASLSPDLWHPRRSRGKRPLAWSGRFRARA